MKSLLVAFASLSSLVIAFPATAQPIVFFEEEFNGPALDPSIWRTEIITSGPRWCDTYPGAWEGPGTWVAEGSACYGVAAYSPYGTAALAGGLLQLSSTNGQACPYVVSRFPGSAPIYPMTGDFTMRVRMRFDHITWYGTFLVVLQTQSTEPVGGNPVGRWDDVLLMIAGDGSEGFELYSALDGSCDPIAFVPSASELQEFALECVGSYFTVRAGGEIVYGPVTSTLRPAAVFMGNPVLAYWGPTDWCWFSVDYLRVEVPGTVPVEGTSWGAVKALYRGEGQ